MTQFEMITSTESSGRGIFSISPFKELNVHHAAQLLVFARKRQHVIRRVQPICLATWTHALRREQYIDAPTRAEIKNDFSGAKIGQCSRIPTPKRSLGGLLGNRSGLICTIEICGDRIAASEAGVTTCLHPAGLRYSASGVSVLLLYLFLNTSFRFHKIYLITYAKANVLFSKRICQGIYNKNVSHSPKNYDLPLLFAALADRTRLRLLNLMDGKEVCVCYLVEILGQSQPKISKASCLPASRRNRCRSP